MITILSASHNQREYVVDCLDSVLKQDFKEYKFIMNENSTDDITRKIVRKWFKENPTARFELQEYNYHKAYREEYAVPHPWINEEMEKVKEGYILWLADDDYLHSGALRKMYNFATENEHKVIYWRAECYKITKDGSEVFVSNQHSGTNLGNGNPSPDCLIDGGSALIHHSVLQDIEKPWYDPYKHDYHKGNYDGEFLDKIAQKYTFYNLNETLCRKRQTPSSHWHPSE